MLYGGGHISSAIKDFIEANEWQVQEIKSAVKKADQPDAKFADHRDVAAWLDTWGSKKAKEPHGVGKVRRKDKRK